MSDILMTRIRTWIVLSTVAAGCAGSQMPLRSHELPGASPPAPSKQVVLCASPQDPVIDQQDVWACVRQTRKGPRCYDCCEQAELDFAYCKQEFGLTHECADSSANAILACIDFDCDIKPSPDPAPPGVPAPGHTNDGIPYQKKYPKWPWKPRTRAPVESTCVTPN